MIALRAVGTVQLDDVREAVEPEQLVRLGRHRLGVAVGAVHHHVAGLELQHLVGERPANQSATQRTERNAA
jgi:hypothetical protein